MIRFLRYLFCYSHVELGRLSEWSVRYWCLREERERAPCWR